MSRLGKVGQDILGTLFARIMLGKKLPFEDFPPAPSIQKRWPWISESFAVAQSAQVVWPRISIVTPSYNQGKYLEETIRSVLLQDYPNLEYIVIDGGSTDMSVEIIEKYSPWLTYWVSEKDRGQGHAINKGFERCTGDIITFLSSDDMYLPGAFASMATHWLQEQTCGFVVGAFQFLNEYSELEPNVHQPRLPHEGPIDLSVTDPESWRLHQVSTFYSRAALDAVGRYVPEDLHYVMDRELLYRVCRKYKARLVARSLGAFRKHQLSKSAALQDILPFAYEFAELHTRCENGSLEDKRRRSKLAGYRRARGYMKLAATISNRGEGIHALAAAAFHYPALLLRRNYLRLWLNIVSL